MINEYLKILNITSMPSFLKKYLDVPCLKRLTKIGYFCGMDYASKYIYNFTEKITRYDHSLTVALLTWKITNDKKSTLAGLFHDVATPCFAHVIDYMNGDYEKQESTEEYTESILKSDSKLLELLKRDNIDIDEICDFKRYSIVDNERPKLCTDRLDGVILTGLAWTKTLNIDEVQKIINSLYVYKNEHGEQEIGFQNCEIAELVLKTSNIIDEYCHTKEDNYMMTLLARITKLAILQKIINYNDLYTLSETTLIKMFEECDVSLIRELTYAFETITKEQIPNLELNDVKVRKLSPIVNGSRIAF